MKNTRITFALIIATSIMACTDNSTIQDSINLESKTNTLTSQEIEDLQFLREEEKLAHDVYLFAYDKYNLQVFKNISNSEATHMDTVLQLLKSYNLNDSATTEIGVFNNPELQNIYTQLINQVNISLIEALKVGTEIEDLDINDLSLNENRTEKADLLSLYSSLKCGSNNHLRSFYSQVVNYNDTYSAKYISQETFNEIIGSPTEKCGIN